MHVPSDAPLVGRIRVRHAQLQPQRALRVRARQRRAPQAPELLGLQADAACGRAGVEAPAQMLAARVAV